MSRADNADYYYLGRGLVITTMGDREAALANYRHAILLQRGSANESNPKLAQAYHQKSSLRYELGNIEGANLVRGASLKENRAMAVKLGIK